MTVRKSNTPPDTRPGDFVGTDSNGRVRIDRVIPLHWVLGIIFAGLVNAVQMHYSVRQLAESVNEMKAEVRANNISQASAANRAAEHAVRLQSLERRVDQLESRK